MLREMLLTLPGRRVSTSRTVTQMFHSAAPALSSLARSAIGLHSAHHPNGRRSCCLLHTDAHGRPPSLLLQRVLY